MKYVSCWSRLCLIACSVSALLPAAVYFTPVGETAQALSNTIRMNGVKVRAETIIEAIAKNGLLENNGSTFYANDALIFGSSGKMAIFGNISTMGTPKTSMEAGQGAFIVNEGTAQIRHTSNEGISFYT